MSTTLALARRELGVYFVSPMAYVVLTVLLFLSGLAFVGSMATFAEHQMPVNYVTTLWWIVWILIMASPFLTMRLIAEEKSRGTIEIALTAPISDVQFVTTKFLAAVLFLLYLLLPTAGYVVILSQYGEVDLGAVACGYLGVFLVGALALSIGTFISSLCSNQVTSAIIAFKVSLVLFFASYFGGSVSRESAWRDVVQVVDLSANVMDFFKGVLDLGRVVYLVSGIFLFLYLAVRVVGSRRWK
jgi:ABC-2 type transport system permease protein